MRKIAPNMVFDDDPVKLLDKLEVVVKKFPLPIHEDGRVVDNHKHEPRRTDWWWQEPGKRYFQVRTS